MKKVWMGLTVLVILSTAVSILKAATSEGDEGKEPLKITSVQKEVKWVPSKSIDGRIYNGGHYCFKVTVETNKPAACRIKWYRYLGWEFYTGGERENAPPVKKHVFRAGTLKPASTNYFKLEVEAGEEKVDDNFTLFVPSTSNNGDVIYDVITNWNSTKWNPNGTSCLNLYWHIESKDLDNLSYYTAYYRARGEIHWDQFLYLYGDYPYFGGRLENLNIAVGQKLDLLITGNASLKFGLTITQPKPMRDNVGLYAP